MTTTRSIRPRSLLPEWFEVAEQTLEELIFFSLLIITFGFSCIVLHHHSCPKSLIHPWFKKNRLLQDSSSKTTFWKIDNMIILYSLHLEFIIIIVLNNQRRVVQHHQFTCSLMSDGQSL